jgi:outer membrane protein TolC
MKCCLAAVLGCLLCTGGTLQAQPKPAPKEPDRVAEIRKLLRERRELLQEIMKVLTAQYQQGVIDAGRLLQAQRDLLKANTDLADDPEARRAGLKECLKMAETVAVSAEKLSRAGTTSKVDALQARAIVLEIRTELLREELKARSGKE